MLPYGSTSAARNADARSPNSSRTPPPLAPVLIHPDTRTALTGTLHCAQARIHGERTSPYRLLTHAFAGRDLPPGTDLST
ncbi:hypothetical protein J0X20_00115 [Streptomyces sp. KCTC 0041BP]|uniref:hypothetical protein n=1 Tax=Streptomyces sp. KCTC 0041BP TaxID=201500 RepID=UPI001AE69241|nr:hypothetical protein [Streptomyces sp. KCTC 0041BP]MBP0932063.1 hypothetical protein [Streptomyces sp. KCTC 0041BP]